MLLWLVVVMHNARVGKARRKCFRPGLRAWLTRSRRAGAPGKLRFAIGAKGLVSPTSRRWTRRAEYAETCSLGSTEARRSNPVGAAGVVVQEFTDNVISTFDPIEVLEGREVWATRTSLVEGFHQAGAAQSRCV